MSLRWSPVCFAGHSLARLLSGRSRLQVPTEQSNGSHFIPLHHDLHGLSLPIAVLGAAMIMSNER